MKISVRGWLVIGTCFAVVAACMAFGTGWLNAAPSGPPAQTGRLNGQTLGNLLAAMGLEPKQVGVQHLSE